MTNLNTFDFQNKKFLLIGEVHGVKENIKTLKSILDSYLSLDRSSSRLVVAFEWPVEVAEEINDYLKGKIKLSWRKWNFVKYGDGRKQERLKRLLLNIQAIC